MNSIYLYCIAEKFNELNLTGINGLPIEKTGHKALCLVFSSIKTDVEHSEKNYYNHENVLERLFEKNITILPFRFGTVVAYDSDNKILKENYGDFLEHVEKLKGKAEMGVRALWNYDKVCSEIENDLRIPELCISNERIKGYLGNKMRTFKIDERIKACASEEAEKIHKMLSDSFEGVFTIMNTNSIFFSGAYLIDRMGVSGFYTRVRQIENSNKEYSFLITGPWPPFNFCSIEI